MVNLHLKIGPLNEWRVVGLDFSNVLLGPLSA